MNKATSFLAFFMLSGVVAAWCAPESGPWVTLESDNPDAVRRIVAAEVNKRDDFSTTSEERSAIQEVEKEKAAEESAYKKAITDVTAQFNKTRKSREDLVEKYQGRAKESEELQKSILGLNSGIASCKSQIERAQQEMATQRSALKKWLKSEKQGEAVAAVIYTRGLKDTAHALETLVDQVSAPLMVEQMGVTIKSRTTVINHVLADDYITATSEGSVKPLPEEPLRLELDKSSKGTVYLRLKRYELFPFQEPASGKVNIGAGASRMKGTVLSSDADLELFLSSNGYQPASLDLSRARALLADANQASIQGNEGLADQVNSFEDKIRQQQEHLESITADREAQATQLAKKESQYTRLQGELEQIKTRKVEAEKEFSAAQAFIHEKKRLRKAIVTKTTLAIPKGGESSADAIAAMVIDKLEEVKNDAKTQHATATTTVANGMLNGETSAQAATDARITGLRLISFINEGDRAKVEMAFRVETELHEVPIATGQESGLTLPAKANDNIPQEIGTVDKAFVRINNYLGNPPRAIISEKKACDNETFFQGDVLVFREMSGSPAFSHTGQRRIMAEYAAEAAALKIAAEFLSKFIIHADDFKDIKVAPKIMDGLMALGSKNVFSLFERVEVEYIRQNDRTGVLYRAPLYGPNGLMAALYRAILGDPKLRTAVDSKQTLYSPPGDLPYANFDGLVIDARSIEILPALANRIFTDTGYLLFTPLNIPVERLTETGGIIFTANEESARRALSERGVQNPLVVQASGAQSLSDLNITAKDALVIYAASRNNKFLEQGNIALVLGTGR